MKTVEEAGAIIVGTSAGHPAVLLVTAKRNPDNWIFPKGHVEKGETLEEAALREAEEEAGTSGRIVQEAGSLSFMFEGHTYRVHYFVVATDDPGRPEKGRRMRWCSYDEAMALLTFEDSRTLLARMWPAVSERLRSGRHPSPPGTSDRK